MCHMLKKGRSLAWLNRDLLDLWQKMKVHVFWKRVQIMWEDYRGAVH